MFIVSGIYSLAKNFYQDDCFNYLDLKCGNTNIIYLSLANKSKSYDLITEQAWVNFASAMAIIVALHFYRRRQNLTENESLRGLNTPSNYTIMVNNIPPGQYNDVDLRHLLINNWKKRSDTGELVIKKIVQAYFIGDYIALLRTKNQLASEKRKYLRYRKKKGNFPPNVDIDELNNKINEVSNQIQQSSDILRSNLDKTCGTIFVTFDTIGMAQEFVKRYKLGYYQKFKASLMGCCYSENERDNIITLDKKILHFEIAKDPEDILWENLGYSYKERLKKRSLTVIATCVLLLVCFGLIWAISYGKVLFEREKKNIFLID